MKTEIQDGEKIFEASLENNEKKFIARFLDEQIEGEILKWDPPSFILQVGQRTLKGLFYRQKDWIDIQLPMGTFRVRYAPPKSRRSNTAHTEGHLNAPMPGKVVKVCVQEGEPVKKGDLLMILEAMKMEHKIVSPKEGVIEKIRYREGDRVSQGEDLIDIKS